VLRYRMDVLTFQSGTHVTNVNAHSLRAVFGSYLMSEAGVRDLKSNTFDLDRVAADFLKWVANKVILVWARWLPPAGRAGNSRAQEPY